MPWVDDVLEGLQVQIDAFTYDLLRLIAMIGWTLQKGLFLMGHAIELANLWLVENAFTPLISQTNNQLQMTASFSFMIALLVLGITYMLAIFVRMDVVSPKGAIGWYLAGVIFFQSGPELYQSMHQLRSDLSAGFYAVALDSMQTGGGPFSSLNSVTSDQLDPGTVCNAFGTYTPGFTGSVGEGIDGLDVALAYLRADSQDVMGYPSPIPTPCVNPRPAPYDSSLPSDWQLHPDGYFYTGLSSDLFGGMPSDVRKESIDRAAAAQFRIFSAWSLVIFGVVEQLIFLLLTIAQGLTFVSFSVAILFAFFRKTEIIARSILDLWIELIVQTVAIALMQSLIVSFLLGGAATNNALVVLGVSLLCTIFIIVLLRSGILAVWNSFNRLFGAIGQATGGVMVAPGRVAAGAAAAGVGAAVGGAALAANVGGSAVAGAQAASQGATASQAAGIALGGSRRLQTAARTLAYMPGTRNTRVGQMADEFTEGAALKMVGQSLGGAVLGPTIGARLLSDRGEEAKKKRGVSLPAEPPRDHDADGEVYAGHLDDQPAKPKRMGTFTPLADNAAAQPQSGRFTPVAIGNGHGTDGHAVEGEADSPDQIGAVKSDSRAQAGQTRAAVDRTPATAGDQAEEVEDRVTDVGATVRAQAGQTRAAVDRTPAAAGDQAEEIEDRVTDVGAAVRTQAGQTRATVDRTPAAAGDQAEEIEDRVTDVGAAVRTQAGQTRAVVDRTQAAAGDQAEEVEDRVTDVGAAVRTQAGQTRAEAERATYASDRQGEEVEERIATLGAQMQAGNQPQQPVMGLMTVEGTDNVAGVMGDFVAQTRAQRTMDGEPVVGGADNFAVAQGVAQVMGVTPAQGDHAPVVGDVARLGMFGNQALQMGLTGQQVQTVVTEVQNSPTGELTQPTRTMLVDQARGTLNTGFEGAEQAVSALQQAAAMLPNAITARGSAVVPAAGSAMPPVATAPPTVTAPPPTVQVTVAAPANNASSDESLSPAAAALASSQAAQLQRGASS